MKPDRTNYEMWLVDYLDGNLNGEQVSELLSFLDENPDIKEEFDGISALPASELSFGKKHSLRKSALELSDTQFELLCAASVEKDLSSEQKAELDEIIACNDERRKAAVLFSRTKLSPPETKYRYKQRLKKLTFAQKVIRISAIGLSAAATVLIMFTVFRNPEVNKSEPATGYSLQATGSEDKQAEENIREAETTVPVRKEEVKLLIARNLISKINNAVSYEMKVSAENNAMADTSLPVNEILKSDITRIAGITEMSSATNPINASLVSMTLIQTDPYEGETGNAVGNFFARVIREKIVKSETPEKGNLKAYEVADAGITGLNKLFGSNMILEKTIDENGEVKSVYFNSKLLKFNAPVKKAEPLE